MSGSALGVRTDFAPSRIQRLLPLTVNSSSTYPKAGRYVSHNTEPLSFVLTCHTSMSVDVTVAFWRSSVSVRESSPFQITIVAPSDISTLGLSFTSIRIEFGEEKYPLLVVEHSEGSSDIDPLQRVDVGELLMQTGTSTKEVKADLRWPAASSKVFSGSLISPAPLAMKVCRIPLQWKWRLTSSSGCFYHLCDQARRMECRNTL